MYSEPLTEAMMFGLLIFGLLLLSIFCALLLYACLRLNATRNP